MEWNLGNVIIMYLSLCEIDNEDVFWAECSDQSTKC